MRESNQDDLRLRPFQPNGPAYAGVKPKLRLLLRGGLKRSRVCGSQTGHTFQLGLLFPTVPRIRESNPLCTFSSQCSVNGPAYAGVKLRQPSEGLACCQRSRVCGSQTYNSDIATELDVTVPRMRESNPHYKLLLQRSQNGPAYAGVKPGCSSSLVPTR